MADTSASDQPPVAQTNGIINSDLEDMDERAKMRPADIDADVREMERRKRVELIMNSKLFREELERIIEVQLRDGSSTSGLMQQISDMMGGVGGTRGGGGHSFKHTGGCVLPINDIRGLESMGYAKGEKILRCKLASVYRLIDLYGWTQSASNLITARLNQDEEHFLVNPYGMLFHEITASSLIKVDMQGNVVEQGTTNFPVHLPAYALHAAIHSARPDIRCILHVATPSVIAVSAIRGGLLSLSKESAVIGQVSRHAYYGGFDPAEKDRLIQDLGAVNKVLLLTNQGAICCGETIEEAFYNARNTVLACESQLKLMPIGIDNLLLLTEETCKQLYDAAHRAPENSPRPDQPSILETKVERKWRVGGVEFEALMRMLDNAGFRTGYIYRHPLVKGDPPRPRNDVEVPPAVSSLGYLLEEEEMYKQGLWKKLEGGRKGHDRSRWLNSPNVYQKVEILETGTPDPKKITKWVPDGSPTHSSTPVKIESALQFVPKNTNPKEFKVLQQQLKDYRRADKISAGPQSQILEGVTWEEARKMQDAGVTQTGDHVVLMGAASKGIIQRGYQHNATMYKAPYAKNPFDCVTDEEIDEYKKDIERKKRGEYDTDYSESEGLSSAHINKRISDIRSPTSETEEESRDEPQVLRIETKHVQKASLPEVVLSDGLRMVPALTPTTAGLNQALYRTNTHYGLPKGRYTQPNPLHFHITRYSRVATHFKPYVVNLQYPKRHFNTTASFRTFKNDNVSIKIGNSEPISLNLSIRSLREFIYPFAHVLNLNVPSGSSPNNLTQQHSSYITPTNSSSNDGYVSLTDRSCQTSRLVENNEEYDASLSDFEFSIINNMHDNLVKDLTTNYGEGLNENDAFEYDYVEKSNFIFNIDNQPIYDDVDDSKSKDVGNISSLTKISRFEANLLDSKSPCNNPKGCPNVSEAPSVVTMMPIESIEVSPKSSVHSETSRQFIQELNGFKNNKLVSIPEDIISGHGSTILNSNESVNESELALNDSEFISDIDESLSDVFTSTQRLSSMNSKHFDSEIEQTENDKTLANSEEHTIDSDSNSASASSSSSSAESVLGENELPSLFQDIDCDDNDAYTIWDRSSNGQDYYSTFDVLHLLNFNGTNIRPEYILNYYAQVLENVLISLRDCTAVDLNETIFERRYGKCDASLFKNVVSQNAKMLVLLQLKCEDATRRPIAIYLPNPSHLIRANYINKMLTWGNRTLRVNITRAVEEMKNFSEGVCACTNKDMLTIVSNFVKLVDTRLQNIEIGQKDKFILKLDGRNDTALNILKSLSLSNSKIPLTISKASSKPDLELAHLQDTLQFLKHFEVTGKRDIPNLIWSIENVDEYLTEKRLTLSCFDVQILTSCLHSVDDSYYQVQLSRNKSDWFLIKRADFDEFLKPWLSKKELQVLERANFEGYFNEAKNWMFQKEDTGQNKFAATDGKEDVLNSCLVDTKVVEDVLLEDVSNSTNYVDESKLIGENKIIPCPFDKLCQFELPNDFEFELSELLNDLIKHDERITNVIVQNEEEFEQQQDEPSYIDQDTLDYFREDQFIIDLEELNIEYSFTEKNYDTFYKFHQKVTNKLSSNTANDNNSSSERSVDSSPNEHHSREFLNQSKIEVDDDKDIELDLDDLYLSDEGLGNSINATKTVTPKDDNCPSDRSLVYYDEVTSTLGELILTFIKEQTYEIKELVIFPDLLCDDQVQKVLRKLLDIYQNNCTDFTNLQKTELRLNIASYCLNRLELNESNDSGTNIISDKVFSITEFISDILDQFFELVPKDIKTVTSEVPKIPHKSPRLRKSTPQKTSTPENDCETVTAFHIHKRKSSERFWVSIHKSPRNSQVVLTPKVTKVFNVDDIPLKLPTNLQEFEQFRFIVNDAEDKALDLEDDIDNSSRDINPFQSRLASFEEKVKLDNLFTECQPDYNLPSTKVQWSMSPILEESSRNLFPDDQYSSESDPDQELQQNTPLKASKVKLDLLNDTADSLVDPLEKGDYIAFDRPEINLIVSSEVNFYRTNTINTSAFICESSITFTRDKEPISSCSDSRSNDQDSSLDVISETEEEMNRDETSEDWLGENTVNGDQSDAHISTLSQSSKEDRSMSEGSPKKDKKKKKGIRTPSFLKKKKEKKIREA